jgi:hypothetical protein
MDRLTMWSTWTWKIAPVFFVIIPLMIGYLDPEARYFSIFFLVSAICTFSFTKAKHLLQLHNIYVNNQNIIIKRSVSINPKIEMPLNNAIKVEYLQFAQQIICKFWYFDPQTFKRTFVYFWPTKTEAKWNSSKLNLICMAAGDKREN